MHYREYVSGVAVRVHEEYKISLRYDPNNTSNWTLGFKEGGPMSLQGFKVGDLVIELEYVNVSCYNEVQMVNYLNDLNQFFQIKIVRTQP